MQPEVAVQEPCALPVTATVRDVLVVDDDPIQLSLMRVHLKTAGFDVRTATGAAEALGAARARRPDVVLSDVLMDELDGFSLCTILRCDPELGRVPIVLLTAHIGGEADRRLAISAGANSLVERSPDFENELKALTHALDPQPAARQHWSPEPSVRRMAGQMAQLLAQSHTAEARYRALFDSANEAIALLTPEGVILDVNHRWEEILQLSRERMVGRHLREFAAPGHEHDNVERFHETIDASKGQIPPIPIARGDGMPVYMEFSNKVVTVGVDTLVLSIGRDVTESVEVRRDLAASEQKYRTLIENIPDVVWSATLEGKITFMSPHVVSTCGFSAEEMLAAPPSFWFDRVHPEDVEAVRKAYGAVSNSGFEAEYRWQRKDGQWIRIRARASMRVDSTGNAFAEGTFADISERRRLEEQVRQSQKMEALGQLTGGVAHDFNNILAIILGNGEFLRETLPQHDPRRADAEAILEAGQRGAALTRQLLAFSRRQVLEPRILDLNEIVQGVETMLRRVIGEDIDLSISLGTNLYAVRADAGQLEQVIMNLVVNARDAMPLGGSLSIETSNVTLDDPFGNDHGVAVSGEFVRLAVSDTGCGMDAETRRRVFEPFFTTKDQGKGTGLGLSTCYGIVKQSEGFIFVYSEPGHGSVFKVYLPRIGAAAPDEATATDKVKLEGPNGRETILLIEDDGNVRDTIRRVLTGRGYRVLEAGESDEAATIAHAHKGRIDLIVSDMVIPGSAGPEVVKRLQSVLGPVRALFMSGYTDHALLRNRLLNGDVNFIQKPFMPAMLAAKVREVLDA